MDANGVSSVSSEARDAAEEICSGLGVRGLFGRIRQVRISQNGKEALAEIIEDAIHKSNEKMLQDLLFKRRAAERLSGATARSGAVKSLLFGIRRISEMELDGASELARDLLELAKESGVGELRHEE